MQTDWSLASKAELRSYCLSYRATLHSQSTHWGSLHWKRIIDYFNLSTQKCGKDYLVAAFYPIKDELNFAEFATSGWYFPKMAPDFSLLWFPYGTKTMKNSFGIPEASSENCSNLPELLPVYLIVPALAVDKIGNRLGYGKGFYDRLLEKHKNFTSICCVPEQMLFEKIPFDSYDKKVKFIATENQIIKC